MRIFTHCLFLRIAKARVLNCSFKRTRGCFNVGGSMNKRYIALLGTVFVAAVLLAALGVFMFHPQAEAPAISQTVEPHYLTYATGESSKLFLESAQANYGYWTQNDTAMTWFTDGPIIHKGDPVCIINATIRNDYTQTDPYKVNPDNTSFLVLTTALYDKNGTQIDAPQAYPRVDTNYFNGHHSTLDSGETATFILYLSTDNRNVDRFELNVEVVSSMPSP